MGESMSEEMRRTRNARYVLGPVSAPSGWSYETELTNVHRSYVNEAAMRRGEYWNDHLEVVLLGKEGDEVRYRSWLLSREYLYLGGGQLPKRVSVPDDVPPCDRAVVAGLLALLPEFTAAP